MLNSQKSAISAAMPPELSKMLGASGLLAGLGGLGAAAAGVSQTRSVDGFERRDRRKFDSQFRRELRRTER